MTIEDYIHTLNGRELAEYFALNFCHGVGADLLEEWLQQPRKVEE